MFLVFLLLSLCTAAASESPAITTETEPATAKDSEPAETPPPDIEADEGRPDPNETEVSMSFDKADINSVVRFLSVASGVPIVCDADLKGNVTIVSLKQIPLSDAFEVVNSALRVRGYGMVGTLESKVIRVVPLKKAVTDRSVVQAGKDPGDIDLGDSMVTQIIPVDYVSVTKLKDELKPLVSSDEASLVAISSTNTLIVTDNSGNVRRIAQIVQELDNDLSDATEVKVYPCKYSSADALVDTLKEIFKTKEEPTKPQPGRPPSPPKPGAKPAAVAGDGLIMLKGEVRISSDARTNSLIISASPEKIELVMDVIESLDVDTEAEVQVKFFPLEYADATMVAQQLNNIFEQPQGGISGADSRSYPYYPRSSMPTATTGYAGLKRNVVVADVRTNSVIVTATEQNMKSFEIMIDKLDALKVLSEITRLFRLKYARAPDLADTLNRLFRGEYRRPTSLYDIIYGGGGRREQEGGPLAQLKEITVVAEEKTNTLLVTGPPQAFTMVESMIEQLDRRSVQVFIEVAIVDVTLDDESKFGIEWNWTSTQRSGRNLDQTAGTDFGLSKETSGLKYSVISDNLKALLHALKTRSNVKVYSTPTITTADNVEATISIGRDEPYVSSEMETTGGNFRRTVDFKNVAIALTVTPHVTEASDLITLDVRQTINEIIGREPELNAPIVASRLAETTIMVKDGQTIVIGGIIKENQERVTRRVPLLSEIPILGELFKSRHWRHQKSELMVFLTPHVLKDDDDVDETTELEFGKLTYPPVLESASGP